MLAMGPIRFRYVMECIHGEIFFFFKCDSENMARNVAAQFPPDLEPQCTSLTAIDYATNKMVI